MSLQPGFAFETDPVTKEVTVIPTVDAVDIVEAFTISQDDEELFEKAVEALAQQRTMEAFRKVLLSLPPVPAYLGLQRVILGTGGEDRVSAASKIGKSHTSVAKWERRVRESLEKFHGRT